MNLIPQIGMRAVYSWKELESFTGLKQTTLKWLVRSGRLQKFSSGAYPFSQKHINEFLARLNSGEIVLGMYHSNLKGGTQ